MKRLVFACASLIGGGRIYSQGGGNPFHDHSDTGETIHVLPGPAALHNPHDTQPTIAPPQQGTAVFPPSFGSGDLIDHGGLEIAMYEMTKGGFWVQPEYSNGLTRNGSTFPQRGCVVPNR
jgi:hypothetical protein